MAHFKDYFIYIAEDSTKSNFYVMIRNLKGVSFAVWIVNYSSMIENSTEVNKKSIHKYYKEKAQILLEHIIKQ
jgi:hypothetical protein